MYQCYAFDHSMEIMSNRNCYKVIHISITNALDAVTSPMTQWQYPWKQLQQIINFVQMIPPGFEPTKLCTETNHNVAELQHLVDFPCKLLATNEFSHYMEHNEHSLYHTHRCHASSTSVSYCHNVIHIIQKGFALANITSQQYSKYWFFRQTDWPNWHKPDNRSSVNTEMNRWFPIKHCKPRLWLSIERASVFLKMYLTIQSRPIP